MTPPAREPSGNLEKKSPLKLLVFAGVPPPLHGQSLMVSALITGLKADPAFLVVHVDPRLSEQTSEIGRWRLRKFFRLLRGCISALRERLRQGPMVFYYVPAPGKRVAVVRDWIVMLVCRPWFSSVVFHWHAVGLGGWMHQKATAPERWLAALLLGRADLSLVLAPELARDAEVLKPKRVLCVSNGLPDPLDRKTATERVKKKPMEVLFLGLGSEEKGLFRTVDAVIAANLRELGAFRLTFAGAFASKADEHRFEANRRVALDLIHYDGFADEFKKSKLLQSADIFCFPTHYAHEGQPLVLLEAMAYDLPIITTRWRAIPGMLPASNQVRFVDPTSSDEIVDALFQLRAAEPPRGELRQHFLSHFTLDRHLAVMKAALRSLNPN